MPKNARRRQFDFAAPPETAPPPAETLRACAAALTEIATAFGLEGDRLAHAEDVVRLEVLARLSLAQLAAAAPAEVDRWFALFGPDLEVDLRLTSVDRPDPPQPVLLRSAEAPGDTLARFIEQERRDSGGEGDGVAVEARVSLAKRVVAGAARAALALRPGYLGSAEALAATSVAAFFSAEAWCALLAPGQLAEWQRAGLARPDGRAVVVVLGAGGYLAGPALEVAGARELDALPWLDLSAAQWEAFQQRVRSARALRDAESIWTIATCSLTSGMLDLEARQAGLETTAAEIAALREQLAAMELAVAVQASDDETLALRFAGKPVRVCALPARPEGDALSRLAVWAAASETPDRLYIARECLARGFPATPRVALGEVEAAARAALPAAVATFNLYLKRQTDHYFVARQQAVDAIAAYADGVRKSAGELASDVVGDAYKTAGLLAGVVIAALIGPAHAAAVWRLATAAYVLYLVFVLRFLLPARERRFVLEGNAAHQRLNTASELSVEEKTEIGHEATRANAYFRHYLRLAWLVYLGLALAGALYFVLLLTPLAPHLPLVAPNPPAAPPAAR
ncbi:MAG: hypothetical protein ACHQ4H_08465 [Ktedonobacterales bacterium]